MADDDLTPLVSALDIKPTTRYGRPPRMPRLRPAANHRRRWPG